MHAPIAHTLLAELLRAPMRDDPTLGHSYFHTDRHAGDMHYGTVILADEQPAGVGLYPGHGLAGVGLYPGHGLADGDPTGERRVGTLVHLERDGQGAVWGVFTVPASLTVADLYGADRASIRFTGRPIGMLEQCRPTADPTTSHGAAAILRRGQVVDATLDHVALVDNPGAYTRPAEIVPVDVTDGVRNLGFPLDLDTHHRELIRRAARTVDAHHFKLDPPRHLRISSPNVHPAAHRDNERRIPPPRVLRAAGRRDADGLIYPTAGHLGRVLSVS